MMKRAFRDEWSAALRSGNYAQANSTLHDYGNRYCCLGVRCALSGIDCQEEANSCGEEMPQYSTLGDWGLLRKEADVLAGMNDDGKSFSKIADHLDTMQVVD